MNKKISRIIILIIIFAIIPVLFIFTPYQGSYTHLTGKYNSNFPSESEMPEISSFSTGENVTDIAFQGNYVWLADGFNGISCLDLSDPTDPVDLGNKTTASPINAIDIVGNILFASTEGSGLVIFNISDANSPVEISNENTITDLNDVVVSGNYAYLASGSNGLRVINITDINNPSEVGFLSTSNALSVSVEGLIAYIADGNSGVRYIDITDPTIPSLITTIPTNYAHDVVSKGNKLFIADSKGVILVDNSNPFIPIKESEVVINNGITSLFLFDNNLYAVGSTNTSIIDVTYLDRPETLPYNISGGYKGKVFGNYAVLAKNTAGISIVQIAFDYTPHDEYLSAYNFLVPGQSYGFEIVNDIGYFATIRTGLRIVNLSEFPEKPSYEWVDEDLLQYEQPQLQAKYNYNSTQLGYWKGAFDITDVEIRGNIAYLTTLSNGLRCLNISNPFLPVEIGSFESAIFATGNEIDTKPNSFRSVKIEGDIAYIGTTKFADRPNLVAVNISNPTSPTLISNHSFVEQGYDKSVENLVIRGDLAYLSIFELTGSGFGDTTKLYILNISNPTDIVEIKSVSFDGEILSMEIHGNTAYIGYYDLENQREGFSVYNLQNPNNPLKIKDIPINQELISSSEFFEGPAYGLKAFGNSLYCSAGAPIAGGLLLVFDISDPIDPIFKHSFVSKLMTDIQITGTNLYSIERGDFTTSSDGLLSIVKISESGLDDVDGDSLNYLEETAIGTKTNDFDSDGDTMEDNLEVIYGFNPLLKDGALDSDLDGLINSVETSIGTDPTHPDTDLDGYKDGSERLFGADPLSITSYPSKILQYLMIILIIFAIVGAIASFVGVIHAFRKDVLVKVYISHAKEDVDRYNIRNLEKDLENLKQIQPIVEITDVLPERSIDSEINNNELNETQRKTFDDKEEKLSLSDSQVMLFIASDNSLNSEKSKKELEFARKNNIFIIPIKSESIDWPDMATLGLDRELGVEFKSNDYDACIEDVKKFVNNYQIDFTKLREALNKNKISFTNLIEREYDLSPEQVEKLSYHLQKDEIVSGAWLKDKKQFLNLKEIKKRFKKMNKLLKTDKIEVLAEKSGLDTDSVDFIKDSLQKNIIKGDKK